MSAGFIGARVSATLSDGKVIEGVVQSIDPAVGILRLTDGERAWRRTPGEVLKSHDSIDTTI